MEECQVQVSIDTIYINLRFTTSLKHIDQIYSEINASNSLMEVPIINSTTL